MNTEGLDLISFQKLDKYQDYKDKIVKRRKRDYYKEDYTDNSFKNYVSLGILVFVPYAKKKESLFESDNTPLNSISGLSGLSGLSGQSKELEEEEEKYINNTNLDARSNDNLVSELSKNSNEKGIMYNNGDSKEQKEDLLVQANLNFQKNYVKNGIQAKSKAPTKEQNWKKNIPGLFFTRIKKSLKRYYKESSTEKAFAADYCLNYIHVKISGLLDFEGKEKFKDFWKKISVRSPDGNKKNYTYKYLQESLKTNPGFGIIILELIIEFLNVDNPDFRSYLGKTKLEDHTKEMLQMDSELSKIRVRFEEMLKELKIFAEKQ